ncbi:MAG: hypothetical protein LUC26_05595 [Prevotella sp.]|nr:hypothetical protein [Prevotella sp.]
MKQFFQTKWLALALLLCAPLAAWADNSGSGTKVDPFDLSKGDVTLPAIYEATTYYITGDGSADGHTIKFESGSTAKYTITLDGVKIGAETSNDNGSGSSKKNAPNAYTDLTTASTDNTGLYIPAGYTVDFYLTGENSFIGSEYGIYAGSGSTWTLKPIGEIDSNGGNEQKDSTTTVIEIKGKYGIFNEGNEFTIQGSHIISEQYYDDTQNFLGLINIEAVYCGIYSPHGVTIMDVFFNIDVTGNGAVSSTETTPGYSISTLVCGIYADGDNGNNVVTISMDIATITAIGDETYGIFIDASNDSASGKIYFGYGYLEVTATRCCLHRESQYSAGFIYAENSATQQFVLICNGPFCSHYMGTGDWGDGQGNVAHYWYCDEKSDGTGALSDSSLFYIIQDGVDMDNAYDSYNIHVDTEVGEVEYVGRKLYAGWNTLCLPYAYKVTAEGADEEADETYYQYKEARTVIKKYAEYNSDNDDIYGDDGTTITFDILDTTDLTLEADKAYLVWIDDTSSEYGCDYYEQVQFTAMSTTLKHVYNHDSTNEIFFDPVFDAEKMSQGQISGDTSGHTHYKLTAHNAYEDKGGNEVIDREDSGTYKDDGDYTYTGVANYFNKTTSDNVYFPAYRCYIDVDATDAPQTAEALRIVFDDGETTGIDQLNGGTLNAAEDSNCVVNVYGVDGKLVKTAIENNATNGLSKGIYVVNGKKVVVM